MQCCGDLLCRVAFLLKKFISLSQKYFSNNLDNIVKIEIGLQLLGTVTSSAL